MTWLPWWTSCAFRNDVTIVLAVVAKILLFAVPRHMCIPFAFKTLDCTHVFFFILRLKLTIGIHRYFSCGSGNGREGLIGRIPF